MVLSEQGPRQGRNFLTTPSRPARLRLWSAAGPPAWYVAEELLVREEHRRTAWQVLTRRGRVTVAEDPVATGGFRRFVVPGLDVIAAVEEIDRRAHEAGDARPAAGPNHVFMSAPFEHGGSIGPPIPAPCGPVAELVVRLVADRVRVAVLDTGGHPTRASMAPDHGTFVAGVIAQRTAAAEVHRVRVLNSSGICTELDVVRALSRIRSWATLVNLSFGGFCVGDRPPAALGAALAELLGTGDRLVVAAAGNDGERDRPFWPAAFAGGDEPWQRRVVAVAAHDGTDLCRWSNSGSWVTVAAPGTDVHSTYGPDLRSDRGWAVWSGTSFAVPYVVAALVEQVRATGSALTALDAMVRCAPRTYGGCPGLG